MAAKPKQFFEQARFFADHGFVAFSAEYRVKSRNDATPFDCVEDGKSAIRWVRSHAKELGVDPDKIVAAGGSAGGHVAVCTGIIEGHENKNEDLSVSSVPDAMVLFNPVLDTTKNGYGAKSNSLLKDKPKSHPTTTFKPESRQPFCFTVQPTRRFRLRMLRRFTKLMTDAGNTLRTYSLLKAKGMAFLTASFFAQKLKTLPVTSNR